MYPLLFNSDPSPDAIITLRELARKEQVDCQSFLLWPPTPLTQAQKCSYSTRTTMGWAGGHVLEALFASVACFDHDSTMGWLQDVILVAFDNGEPHHDKT